MFASQGFSSPLVLGTPTDADALNRMPSLAPLMSRPFRASRHLCARHAHGCGRAESDSPTRPFKPTLFLGASQGFSSSLVRGTPTDADAPVIPGGGVITSVTRYAPPYQPTAPPLEGGIPWEDFCQRLDAGGL